jgi:hypothetical protein
MSAPALALSLRTIKSRVARHYTLAAGQVKEKRPLDFNAGRFGAK